MEDFNSLGYNVNLHLYLTADYGVPQTRERVFIVGTHTELPKFTPPVPTCGRHITAKEAISDLEQLESNTEFSHIWSLANIIGEQGNRRLVADRAGYTIRSECHGNIQFHYSLPRRISMREAARIQSFPDSFMFRSKLRETERQIGNAVPPVLAWHVAKAVKMVIDKA
jgi:DNA (cytosine-5)-methyltransferase 1